MLWKKITGRYQRSAARRFAQRLCEMRTGRPFISFTFDDFPRSALLVAGKLLESYGVRATYYASLGLAGQRAPTGEIFYENDIASLLERGHELGCHTFSHCHAFETAPARFEASILENARDLQRIAPGATFETLSYPIGSPRPETKRRAARYFSACRGGGQTYNHGRFDLNLVAGFFLEQSRDNLKTIYQTIDAACRDGGWLIFATHDVSDDPTRYGCTPSFFEEVLNYSAKSGAEILPVSQALRLIQ